MNYRKGDVVSVQGVVKHDFELDGTDKDKRVFVDIIGSHETLWIKPGNVTMVQQVMEAGDSVRWLQNAGEGLFLYGVILAVANDHAWIEYGSCEYCTRTLTSIERIQDGSKDDIV